MNVERRVEALKTIFGVILGTVGVVVLLGIIFLSDKVKTERTLVDLTTYCPLDTPKRVWGIYVVQPPASPSRRTAVLIDATDRIPETHRGLIGTWFEQDFTQTLVRFERVAIYELRPQGDTASPALAEPYFDQCAPPYSANRWIENPRLIRETFERDFMEKKLLVIASLSSQQVQPWSPILEAIEVLFADYDRVVLVSDLMQNTPDCSSYQSRDGVREHSGCRTDSRAHLDGKSLNVVFLRRASISSLQDGSLLNFWREYMEARSGAFVIEIELPTILQ